MFAAQLFQLAFSAVTLTHVSPSDPTGSSEIISHE